MSKTVDQRVVEMRFDNRQFESNVSTTMSTLDKLKRSLNLTGASKGLENVSSAAKSCDMSALGGAVDTVKARFSALEVMGVTALANITNSAVNAGKRIVSALTIDPIKTGFSEYETQINAVQTILANTESKGKTLNDVNSALDELNTYADKTIYNFTEMTRNIGTFTAAGVDLDTSVSAIKGIANLAAVSGSTSQQASTAMYQLSQALASGTVKLMDWNSVVNAGMGGQVFQDALKETARVHGIAIDDLIAKEGSFRETLQHGWLSSEILTETLSKFTGDLTEEQLKSMGYTQEQIKSIMKMGQTANDAATKVKTFTQLFDTLKEAAQSGWTQTWEILVGDFEEAKSLLTSVSDVIGGIIGDSAEARNELLENWKVLGGRKDVIESFKNIFEGLVSVITPIKEAFRDIFPPMTAEKLVGFTRGLKDLTAKFKLSDKASENLKRTFRGLFAVVDIAKQIFVAVVKAAASLFGIVGKLGGGILEVTGSFGDWLVQLNNSIKSSDIFNVVLQGVVKVIKSLAKGLGEVLGFLKDKFVSPGLEFLKDLLEAIKEKMFGISDTAGSMKDGVNGAFESMGSAIENSMFYKLLKSLWNGVKIIAIGIGEVLGQLGESFINVLGDGTLLDTLVTGGIGVFVIKLLKNIGDVLGSLGDTIEEAGGIFGGIKGILDDVRGCFEAYQEKLKAETLKKIAVAIAILTASLVILSMIDKEKLTNAIGAITVLFTELLTAMKIFSLFSKDIKGMVAANTQMISMSLSVLILASALRMIAKLKPGELAGGLIGVAGLMAVVIGAAKIMQSEEKTMISGATQMILFAAAVKILASVCKDLSALNWGELIKGLVGVGILLAEVSIFMRTAEFSKGSITTATGIVLLASAIKILASACADFGSMNWSEIRKGLTSVGILLAELAIFTKLTGNAKHVISTGISLIAISAAMKIFASAMGDLGGLSWESIAKGLISMAVGLTAITIALNLMPTSMVGKAVGLIGVATAIVILAEALDSMGGMSWIEIAKGMTALGGAMAILAIGLNLMRGTAGGSAALLLAAIGITALVPALKMLGSMSWSSIAKGLVAMAGAFTLIGIAGALLAPMIPAILGLAAAMALVGVGVLAAGAGLIMLSAGLTSFVAALSVSLGLIVELIPALITGFVNGIADMIVALCDGITNSAKALGRAIKTLILVVCDVLIECLPVITETALKLVVALLDQLVEYTPQIVDALLEFCIGVIEGVADNIPDLIKACVKLISSLFSGVVEALGNLDTKSIIEGLLAVGLLAGIIAALSAITPFIPGAMAGVVGAGVVAAELALVLAALGALAQIPGLTWLVNEGGKLLQGIGKAIGGLVGGLVGGIAEGITSSLPEIGNDLSEFMTNLQPFIEGASRIDSSVMSGVKSIIGVVLALTGANLLESLTSWITGGSSLTKFGEELASFAPNIKSYADTVSGIDSSAVEASANAAKALAQMAAIIPNQGGMTAWFTGDNSVSKFGDDLVTLGEGLKGFGEATAGVNPENIVAAANAAKALSEMVSIIPNSGGVAAWFAGDNSISKFSKDIIGLGEGLKGFSDKTVGIVPENIVAAANAAKVLAEMASIIPNSGGIAAWFAGDNSISKFGKEIVSLGEGLKGFSDKTIGIVPENIMAAANAAKALASMADTIPNEGGMVAWFTGDNSVSKFSSQLPALGMGLRGFSDAVLGIAPENVTAAANAAKTLAQMSEIIPNEGGMVAWFTGDNSVSKFGSQLPMLGYGLKGFSDALAGIVPENLVAAANAAKTLAEIANVIPNEGGMVAWFTGENSVSKFGGQLPALGAGLKGFSDSLVGIVPENVTAAANAAKSLADLVSVIPNEDGIFAWFTGESGVVKFASELPILGTGFKAFSDSLMGMVPENMTAAANAGKALADLVSVIPNEDGIFAWFTGESGVVKFAGELPKLGAGLKGFSDSVAGINPENTVSAANAAQALAEMTKHIPKEGGVKAWFTGETSIASWAGKLPKLGTGLKGFSDSVAGINPENITAAANAAKSLAQMTEYLPKDFDKYKKFGNALPGFGEDLKSYFSKTADISSASIDASSNALKSIKEISGISAGNIEAVSRAIKGLTKAVSEMAEEIGPELEDAGKEAIEAFIKGIDGSLEDAVSAFESVISECADAASNVSEDFKSAGANVVAGFANGISANSYKAEAKARAMAKAAAAAAKKALNEHSPSKVFYEIGDYAGLGFVNALGSYESISRKTGAGMAESAKLGLKDAISRIGDVIDSDMDMQPTIRPVLDLSDIRSGAGMIGNMLNSGSSVGVLSNVNAIGAMMARRNQNRGDEMLASEINKLRNDLGKVGNTTYSINGITYDDGSNVTDAVEALVRALRLERRI